MAEAVLGLRWVTGIRAATPQVLLRTAAAAELAEMEAMRQAVATLPAEAVVELAAKALTGPVSTQAVAVVRVGAGLVLPGALHDPPLRHSQTLFCAMQWPPVRRVSTAARRVVPLRQPVGAAPVQSLAVATAGTLVAAVAQEEWVVAVASSAEAVAAQETVATAAVAAQTAPAHLARMASAAQLAYSFSTDRTPT